MAATPRRRGPITLLYDALSSVWLGVTTLVVLFVYMAIGSAGILYPVPADGGWAWRHLMVRQLPVFELTEFAWFHTWFFIALCALLTVNLIVTTFRRIPFNIMKLGVWTIHTGIVTMTVGSVIYFSQKIEGDTPVFRRAIEVSVPGNSVTLPALAGNAASLSGNDGVYTVSVSRIDPQWPILSGEHAGEQTYAVSLMIDTPTGERFMRQLLAGYPQYTEDLVFRAGEAQPFQRIVNMPDEFGGRKLLDLPIDLSFTLVPQDSFWVKDSSALYVREAGAASASYEDIAGNSTWTELPINKLPRYNDYIDSARAVWPSGSAERALNRRALAIEPERPRGEVDPLAGYNVRITGYLRYAAMRDRFEAGGEMLNPAASVIVQQGSRRTRHELAAFDASRTVLQGGPLGGVVAMQWAEDADEHAAIEAQMRSYLSLDVPATGDTLDIPVSEAQPTESGGPFDTPGGINDGFRLVGDSGWSYRIREVANNLQLAEGEDPVSLVDLDLRSPEGEAIRRWVFAEAAMTRDITDLDAPPAEGTSAADERIIATYTPAQLPPIVLVASPADKGSFGSAQGGVSGASAPIAAPALAVLALQNRGAIIERPVTPGAPIPVGPEVSMTVERAFTHARVVSKPLIIPEQQRVRNADLARLYSMIEVEVAETTGPRAAVQTDADPDRWSTRLWLPFHKYSFEHEGFADASLAMWRPGTVTLPNGRTVELMFSREREPLPVPVVLEEFHLKTNIGGFTGETASIRDWVSEVRFANTSQHVGDAWQLPVSAPGAGDNIAPSPIAPNGWSELQTIATNSPVANNGMWYFQAFWDAPRQGSAGLNFTGLGVTNREGVYTMLIGSCLSVLGLIYAFYVKPILQRRRVAQALAGSGRKRTTPTNEGNAA